MKKQTRLYIEESIHRESKSCAAQQGVTLGDYVDKSLDTANKAHAKTLPKKKSK